MMEEIVKASPIISGHRALEVGCGTGIATKLFAERDYSITALEPGESLIREAKRTVQSNPAIQFINQTLENWPLENEAFDLVFSAEAFHWVDKSIGYTKVCQALKKRGVFALFWNLHADENTPVNDAILETHYRICPKLYAKKRDYKMEELAQHHLSELKESRQFDSIREFRYPWEDVLSTESYIQLLNTYSDYRVLAPKQREDLFREIRKILDAAGGTVTKQYVTLLLLTQKNGFNPP